MTGPSRIKAVVANNGATVRVLMSHPMEPGQRKDADGKLIPPWHIQNVTVSLNGKVILTAEWGGGVSKNPFLQFPVKGAKAGDKITIAWEDNRGMSRSDEAIVA